MRHTASALASDDRNLLVVGLYVAREQNLPVDEARLAELLRNPDPGVREGAAKLTMTDAEPSG